MTSRKSLSPFGIGVLSCMTGALLAASGAWAQQDFSAVEVKALELGNGLSMLSGAGGNIAVSVGADGVLLVDDDYSAMNAKVKAAVAKLTPKPVRFVLNTHWHGDHSGGNEGLAADGAVVIAQQAVRDRMSKPFFSPAANKELPASPDGALPVVTYVDGLTLFLNGETIEVRHVDPAHTDGDSIIHFRGADVIHTGDTYFNGMYPYVDVASGGSLDGLIAAAEQTLALAGPRTRLIPGHGGLSTPEELKAWRAMLVDVRERVRKLIAEGKSRAQVVAAQPTWTLDQQWGQGYLDGAAFTGIVYDSLTDVAGR